MDIFVKFVSNMNSKTRNQIIIVVISLFAPSLVYLTINFPKEIYTSDTTKVLLMGICANFFINSISLALHLFSDTIYDMISSKSIHTSIELLIQAFEDAMVRNSVQNIPLEEIESSNEEDVISNLKKDLKAKSEIKFTEEILDDLNNELNDRKDFMEIMSQSSLSTISLVILCCIVNVTFSINIEFSVNGIFRNVIFYIISYFISSVFTGLIRRDPIIETAHEQINNLKRLV